MSDAPIEISFAYRVRYSVTSDYRHEDQPRAGLEGDAIWHQFADAVDEFARQWAKGRGLVLNASSVDTYFKWPPRKRGKRSAP